MPLCVVYSCNRYGGHRFPKNEEMREKWVQAIRRQSFKPSNAAVVCSEHFLPSDYKSENFETGEPLKNKMLRKDSVPSIFPWKKKLNLSAAENRTLRAKNRTNVGVFIRDRPGPAVAETDLTVCEVEEDSLTVNALSAENTSLPHSVSEFFMDLQCPFASEIEVTQDETNSTSSNDRNAISEGSAELQPRKAAKHCRTCQCNSTIVQSISVESQTIYTFSHIQLTDKPQRVAYYTGLENYSKFQFVLQTLGPAAYELNYRYYQVENISVEDQFFMTVMKIRRAIPDLGLAMMFDVIKKTVQNIVVTWINFMCLEWKKLNIWPSKDLIWYYMPDGFKDMYPSTRAIIDGTEFPINASKDPLLQQSTFSTYKNRHTLKNLVACSPGGLINYCSDSYGGSTSDRAIVERSDLTRKCDPGDSLMADRGFTVQDLFAPCHVSVNMPAFLKGKAQLPGMVLLKDRKLASKRVHIDRIIGMTKTYKILKAELPTYYVPLGSEIFYICCMLCNFREGIVHSKA